VTLVDTGDLTMTGGRLKKVRQYIEGQDFCMTYGDGLSDVDLDALLAFHRVHGCQATVTAVLPVARFGAMVVEEERVTRFEEKPQSKNDYINAGFFVLSPKVLDLIEGDDTIWERRPMEALARNGELCAFRHVGFWHPMDTLRDKLHLEDLWSKGSAPWLRW
jgi:glucose-1-phosphate cytidylyltransferase